MDVLSLLLAFMLAVLASTSSEKPSLLSPEMENSVPISTVAFHTTVTPDHFSVARRHGHLIYVPAPHPDPTQLTLQFQLHSSTQRTCVTFPNSHSVS